MSSYYASPAVVLSAEPSGESDIFLTIYTEFYGRIDAGVKSARLAKGKLKAHLTLFAYTDVIFIGIDKGHRIIDARVRSTPRQPYGTWNHAKTLANFVMRIFVSPEADPDAWNVLRDIYTTSARWPKSSDELFERKLDVLRVAGMLPESQLMTDAHIESVLQDNHL